MRILHTADLHLGKRLYAADLSDDQDVMLEGILRAARDADAVVLAGDCYNVSQPSPDVISRFSRFLTSLVRLGKPVLLCRGNHDGEAQIAYASELLAAGGLYVTGLFTGRPSRVELRDGFGPVHVYLLPYIKPAQARKRFPDRKIETYADAVCAALDGLPVDTTVRNVLVTHQFVSGGFVSDSEEATVGGAERIDPDLFRAFDYVALGHLHRAQTLAGGRIRYSGSPLTYSFEEREQKKSLTLVDLGEKGEPPALTEVPVEPLHRLVRHEGTLEEICALPPSMDYVQATLTDEIAPMDAVAALRATFPNLLNLRLADRQADVPDIDFDLERVEERTPFQHFSAFFAAQNGREPNERQAAIMRDILTEGGARE